MLTALYCNVGRKGTIVHPDYQKRGFGTVLTQHCSAIANKSGDRLWTGAKPSSVQMFKNNGFREVASYDARVERWGLDQMWGKTVVLVKEPSR